VEREDKSEGMKGRWFLEVAKYIEDRRHGRITYRTMGWVTDAGGEGVGHLKGKWNNTLLVPLPAAWVSRNVRRQACDVVEVLNFCCGGGGGGIHSRGYTPHPPS
jgi:hypothetical protein